MSAVHNIERGPKLEDILFDCPATGDGRYYGAFQKEQPLTRCKCEEPPFFYLDYDRTEMGMDSMLGDVATDTCKTCGRVWLKYMLDEAHYKNSGRWWRVELTDGPVDLEKAKEYIERKDSCFVGGSFHDSTGKFVGSPCKVK